MGISAYSKLARLTAAARERDWTQLHYLQTSNLEWIAREWRPAVADHLLATGLRNVSTFRFDETSFAVARERAFVEHARAAGARTVPGWGGEVDVATERDENPASMLAWLRSLPKYRRRALQGSSDGD